MNLEQQLTASLDRLHVSNPDLLFATNRLHYPGIFIFLAYSNAKSPPSTDFYDALIKKINPDQTSPKTLASFQKGLRALKRGSFANEDLNGLSQEAFVQLASQGLDLPITQDEAKEIVQLLGSGEFFSDIGSATAAIALTGQRIPIPLSKDILIAFPFGSKSLLRALIKDLGAAPTQLGGTLSPVAALTILDDLRDGRLDAPPKLLLTNTFRLLYHLGSVGEGRRMLASFLSDDNKTVRLAILIYARSQGVNLSHEDLNFVRDQVLVDDPDFDSIMTKSASQIQRQFGSEAPQFLESLTF